MRVKGRVAAAVAVVLPFAVGLHGRVARVLEKATVPVPDDGLEWIRRTRRSLAAGGADLLIWAVAVGMPPMGTRLVVAACRTGSRWWAVSASLLLAGGWRAPVHALVWGSDGLDSAHGAVVLALVLLAGSGWVQICRERGDCCHACPADLKAQQGMGSA